MDDAKARCCPCLSHVNGLYGPGTMLGWYLTLAGCLVSWTINPEEIEKDSINADMVTVLLFPLAAAAHLISLARNTLHTASDYGADSMLVSCQRAKALEAPARVMFIWTNITVIMYALPALHHPKRGCVVGLVLIVCAITQWYTYDIAMIDIPLLWRFGKFFGAKQPNTTFTVTIVGFDIVPFIINLLSLRKRHGGPSALEEQAPTDGGDQSYTPARLGQDSEPLHKRLMHNRVSVLIWCAIMAQTPLNRWLHAPQLDLSQEGWRTLFPETLSSFSDLEQIVAIIGGATALALNLLSAGNYRYKGRQARKKQQQQQRDADSIHLQQASRAWHGQSHDE